jgi:hypothetical protein
LCGSIKGFYGLGAWLCQHYYFLLLKQTGSVVTGETALVATFVGYARLAVIIFCALTGIGITLGVRFWHSDAVPEPIYVEEVALSVRTQA